MKPISLLMEELKEKGEKAFIAYITAGDPNLNSTVELVQTLSDAGTDIIELGVPFSDPLADGPTNQKASERALKNGCNLGGIFEAVQEIRKRGIETPLVLFSYLNPIYKYGVERFAKRAKEVGIQSVLSVDLTPESFVNEEIKFKLACEREGIEPIFLLSPTSLKSRWEVIESESKSFIYYVSRTGTTGAKSEISDTLVEELKMVRKEVKKPLVVGFGISKVDQVKSLSPYCDGVIVGSALVKELEESRTFSIAKNKIFNLATHFKKALEKN